MTSRAAVRRLAGSRLKVSGVSVVAGRRGLLSRQEAAALGIFMDPMQLPAIRPAGEADALGLPPFGRGVALLANAIAGTDWYVRRFDGDTGVYDRLEDQPQIATNTYPLQTLWHYRWAVAEDGILYGNHFALYGDVDWRTGRAGWLVPIPTDQVWIQTDDGSPGWYQWVIGGTTFGADEIFHVPFGSRSGQILGRGVLEQYGDWLAGSVAAEEYSRDMFAAGALPPAVISTNQATTPEQAAELKAKWRQLASTREPVILPNGTTLSPVVGNALQSQLVEARTWNAEMAAMAVGVPGWKLGLDGPTMTYQNVETGDIDFVRDSVDRFGRPLTESVSKWLLPAGNELVWDYASRMRADQKSTADVLSTYVAAGIVTVDEARATLNRPPLPAAATPQAPPGGAASDDTDADNAARRIVESVPTIQGALQ